MVRESLEGAALWEEVKSELTKPGIGLSGDQQQRLCSTTYKLMSPRAYWLSTWPFK